MCSLSEKNTFALIVYVGEGNNITKVQHTNFWRSTNEIRGFLISVIKSLSFTHTKCPPKSEIRNPFPGLSSQELGLKLCTDLLDFRILKKKIAPLVQKVKNMSKY